MGIIKHGLTGHPLYSKWMDMKNRCYCKSVNCYKNWGGRGIKVCEQWKNDFQAFYDWSMGSGWKPGLTLEREEVDGNYCPENCVWIPHREQAWNKQDTFWVDVFGETLCLRVAVEKYSVVDYKVVWQRITRDGWDIETALTKPLRKSVNGKYLK